MLVIVVIVVDDGDSIADNSDDNSVDTSADTSGDKADTDADADDADTATHKDGEKLKQNTIDTNIIKAEAVFIDDILLLSIFFP